MGILSKAVKNIKLPERRALSWPRDANKLESWLISGNANGDSFTGKSVDEESAMTATAVWSAVTQISQCVASLPLHMYQRLPDDQGKQKAIGQPLYSKMHLMPNPEMTSMVFREQQMGQKLRWGFSCAELELDESDNIVNLWPLQSQYMKMTRILGEIIFIYNDPAIGKPLYLGKERVLYTPGFTKNGLIAYNPIATNKEAISLVLAVQEYGARFYGNNARPDIILTHPETLSAPAQDRLREAWNKMHQGLSRSHRLAILEEGMTAKEISADPQKAQALEMQKFNITDVARIFNMPVHMLKELSRSTNNNIEFQGLEFVIYTLTPWLVKLEQSYCTQLLSEKQRKKYFFEHSVDGLLRGDSKTRYRNYALGRQWGFLSVNDIRKMENWNPIGEEGDVYMVPLNMIPADKFMTMEAPGQNQPNPPNLPFTKNRNLLEFFKENIENAEIIEEKLEKRQTEFNPNKLAQIKKIQKSFSEPIREAYQTVINREVLAIRRAAEKYLQQRGVSGFTGWVDTFYEEHYSYMVQKLAPVLRAYEELVTEVAARSIGLDLATMDQAILDEMGTTTIAEYWDKLIENHIKHYIHSHSGQLNQIVRDAQPEEVFDGIMARMDGWFTKNADKLVADTIVAFANANERVIWRNNGYTKLVWQISGRNTCQFCKALDGRVVGIDQPFMDSGDVIYVNQDTGAFDIYNPENGTYKEKGLGIAHGNEKVSALKVRAKSFYPPIHLGCVCEIVPEK